MVTIVGAIVAIALIQTFFVKVYTVPTGSMENTLQGGGFFGDRILVDRTLALQGGPQAEEIVVFSRNAAWGASDEAGSPLSEIVKTFGDITNIGPSHEEFLVKRVIATGGHRVSCCDAEGHILVDGQPIDESYVFQNFPFSPGTLDCSTAPASLRCFQEYSVPENTLFVLGDHRSRSNDSLGDCRGGSGPIDSCVKTVPIDRVTGRVFAVAWPLTRWHLL
ncbi:hypothetical protein TI83_02820 [Rathayibacter toxicus]|nr:hypothetical protein TI83_02820 [Rathayibacter toxicus]